MASKDLARRLAALEQQQDGPGKVVVVDTLYAYEGFRIVREMTPEESAERVAAAYREAGPNGTVIEIVWVDNWRDPALGRTMGDDGD